MAVQDELTVDMSTVAADTAKQLEVDQQVEAEINPSEDLSELDATVDPENSSFWQEGDELDLASDDGEASETEADSDEADVPQKDGIITYKANGKDVTLNLKNPEDLEKLTKDLALVDGARKAFSDKNKLRQKLKKIESEQGELSKYKESWDKLEAIKDDPAELYRVLTGEDFNSMIEREAEKRAIYQNASEEDRKIMDYEERIRRMEIAQERAAKRREQEEKALEERQYTAEKTEMGNLMQQEFSKYEFPEDLSPVAANRLRKMLWRNSVADIQDYVKQGYKFSDRMVKKAFKDNASAVQAFYKKVSTDTAKAGREQAKTQATEKAAAAATKNYKSNPEIDDLTSKDPLSIFKAFRKGRR